jgi:hypothetical protein
LGKINEPSKKKVVANTSAAKIKSKNKKGEGKAAKCSESASPALKPKKSNKKKLIAKNIAGKDKAKKGKKNTD